MHKHSILVIEDEEDIQQLVSITWSRQQMIDNIRCYGYEVTPRAVDVQIHGLRKKLKAAGKLIEIVRGIGYRFKGDAG